MVAFKNNMSLLALNTFEVSRLVQSLTRENQQILDIANNIVAHTTFINKKSEELKKKILNIQTQRVMMPQ